MGIQTVSQGLSNEGSTFGFRNKIINGNFDVWQRGTSFSTGNGYGYTADRWHAGSNTGAYSLVRNSSDAPNGSRYYMTVTATGASGPYDCSISQPFETHEFEKMKGKTYTLSFLARSSTTSSISLYLQTNTSEGKVYYYEGTAVTAANINLTSSWTKYTYTFTMPAKSSPNAGLCLNFQTAMTQNKTYDIAQIQLEEGTVATNFENRPYGTELALCQRYYQHIGKTNNTSYQHYAVGLVVNSTTAWFVLPYLVSMRAAPSFTFNSPSNTFANGTTCTAVNVDISTTMNMAYYIYVASGLSVNGGARHYQNSTSVSSLELSAEL